MELNTTIQPNSAAVRCQISLTEPQSPPRSSPSVKSRLPRALLAIGVALSGVSTTIAQSLPPWNTVDDVENGSVSATAADRFGHVFVAGCVAGDGVLHACITRSSDQGVTWINTVHGDVANTRYTGIAAATIEIAPATETTPAVAQDHLVAVSAVGTGEWITRKSLDAGETWETVDIFKHATWNSPSKPYPRGIAIDSTGNLYVVGNATKTTVVKSKTSYASYWLVRKIVKDATAVTAETELGKTTFDLFDTANGGYSYPRGVVCVGTKVFVAGTSGDRWQVRTNSGNGAQWSLVDDFRYDSNYPSEARGITADGSGNLYVAGRGMRPVGKARPVQATPGYWIVRKGTGVGTSSFQTVDQFELEANLGALAYGVSIDPSGNVHVTGSAFATGGSYSHWITRRLAAATGTWSTTDHYFASLNDMSFGLNIVADAFGNVFSAGWAEEPSASAIHSWVVRRQLAP